MLNYKQRRRPGRHLATVLALVMLFTTVLSSCPMLASAEPTAPITWTGAAGDGLWHTAGNWTGGVVPGDRAAVVIPPGATVNVNQMGLVRVQLTCAGNLNLASGVLLHLLAGSALTGGKLAGAGSIEVSSESGSLNWSGGSIEGTGWLVVLSGGTLTVAGADDMVLNRRLDHYGTIAVSVPSGKKLTLLAGCQGTTGSFEVLGGRALEFSGSTHPYTVGGMVDDLGNSANFLATNGASVTFSGGYDVRTTTVNTGCTAHWSNIQPTFGVVNVSGTVVFNHDVDLSLSLNAGVVDGPGNVSLVGVNNAWIGGLIQGSGDLIIPVGTKLSLKGTATKTLNRDLVHKGTLELQISAGGYGALNISEWAKLDGGDLYINLQNSYRPPENTQYTPLTFSSRLDEFSAITSNDSSLSFVANYADTSITLTTAYVDNTAPTWEVGYPKAVDVQTSQLSLVSRCNETGTAYYVVLTDGATAPSAAQVKAGTDSSGLSLAAGLSGSVSLAAGADGSSTINGLTAETAYDIYVVAQDGAGNLQSTPVKVDVTTAQLVDTTPPTLTGFTPNTVVSTPPTQLVLTFDEPVWGQTGKNIRLCRNVGVTTITTSIAADAEQVTGDGTNTIVVSLPAGTLLYGQQYYVIVDSGSFKDSAGNDYAGISSAAIWRFTVGSIWAADYPAVRDITQSTAKVTAKMVYPGTVYCVAVEPQEYAPTSQQVKEGKSRSGANVPAGHSNQCIIAADAEGTMGLENLVPGFEYDVFVVAEDAAGNLSNPIKLPLPTSQPQETDFWSYRSPLPTVNGFWNAEHVNDRFAVLGEHGTLLLSTDGQTWERVETGTTFRLEGIAYGNGLYVLSANDGSDTSLVMTSVDALNWQQSLSVPNTRITDVIFAEDKFVAVADAGKILVSSDGLAWRTVASGTDKFLQGVTHGDGVFVAVGLSGGVTTSLDGETWTALSVTTKSLWSVSYGNGMFVAVGGDGGTYDSPFVFYSSNLGQTWTQNTLYAPGSTLRAIVHDGTRFLALGSGSGEGFAATSTNGSYWTVPTTGLRPTHYVSAAAYANGTFVAAGGWSGISTSADGSTWIYRTVGTTRSLMSVVSSGSLFVAVGEQGTIQTSADGSVWTLQNSGTTNELLMVRYLNNQFVAVGRNGTILTSPDGSAWTSRTSGTTKYLADIAYGAGQYMVVGEDGTMLSSGDNGATWATVTHTYGYPDLNAIGYGNGWFVVLGNHYTEVFRSNDSGSTWSQTGLGDNYAQDIIFVNGRFVAVGYDKAWCSDNNGATWSRWGLNGHYVYSVAYGGGTLMTVGQYGTIYASFDGGDNWTQQDFPTISIDNEARTLYGIAAGPSNFIIVGDRGLTLQSRDFGFAGDLNEAAVAASKAALTFDVIKGTNTVASDITSALSLITDGGDGVSISWTAVPTGYISTADGTVTRPTASTGDITLTLTATLTKGTASDTKAFTLTIKALGLTADEAIALDKAALTWDVIDGVNSSQSQVTSSLVLPFTGANGTTISWSVEPVDSGLNASTGAVTRPSHDQGDKIVTLTATIGKAGGTSQTKSFTITIKATAAPYVPSPDPDPTSVITNVARTPGDWMMDSSLIRTGKATISAVANATSISTAALKRLAEYGLAITIVTPEITLVLSPEALMVEQITEWGVGRAQLDISISEVVGEEREALLTEVEVTNRNGRVTVEGKIYDIKIVLRSTDANGQITSRVLTQLGQEIDLSVIPGDLSELSDDQISRLTAALLGEEANGALSPVWLQGAYVSASNSFGFSTDVVGRFIFVVVEPPALVVDLTIDTDVAYINGLANPIDVPPSLISERTMVPIRFVAEAMGADVLWLPTTKTVRIGLNGRIVELVIGQTDPLTGLDVPAQIVDSRTLVPLRFVAESLGAVVQWLPDVRAVEVLVFSARVE